MNSKSKVLLFISGCISFSILGGILLNANIESGGLVFIFGPFLFSLLIFILNRKKQDFTFLKFNLNENKRWYFLSLILYPLALLFITGASLLFQGSSLHFDKSGLLIEAILVQFIPRMIFAFFEEMGWRGFLELELQKIGFTSFRRHLYIGLVWALWHLPFIFTTSYTTISYFVFVPMFIAGVLILSFIYGFLLQKTNSIWPGVIFHGFSNTLAWSLLTTKFVVISNPVLANISPESVLGLLFFGSIAFCLFSKKETAYLHQ